MSDDATDRQYLLTLLRSALEENLSDDEIADSLDVSVAEVRQLKLDLLVEEEQRVARLSPGQIYADYLIRTHANMREMDRIISDPDVLSVNATAVVNAIKGKQIMLDRIVRVGQDLGVIDKAADRHLHLHAHLSDEELRAQIAERIVAMRSMVSRHGDVPFDEVSDAQVPRAPTYLPKTRKPRKFIEERAATSLHAPPVVRHKGIRKRAGENT